MPANRPHRMDVLSDDWLKLAGAQVSRIAVPVAVCNTTLVLRVLDWSWMGEMWRLSDELIARINKSRPDAEPFTGVTILNPDAKLVGCGRPRGGGKSA